MVIEVLFYLFTGAVAGFLAGLMGVGGGVVIVPLLAIFYHYEGVVHEHIMHYAVSTSIACIVCITATSAFVHYKKKAVDFKVVRFLVPGLLAGGILGSWLLMQAKTTHLQLTFGILVIVMGLSVLAKRKEITERKVLPYSLLPGVGVIVSALGSMLGLGGGFILVPALNRFYLPIKNAIAVSSVCGCIVAIVALTGHMILEVAPAETILPYTIGFVDLLAFGVILITSIVAANLGAKLVYRFNDKFITRIFALFLCAVGINMIRASL